MAGPEQEVGLEVVGAAEEGDFAGDRLAITK